MPRKKGKRTRVKKRFVNRRADGTFAKGRRPKQGRAIAADKRKKARKKVPSGQRGKGD